MDVSVVDPEAALVDCESVEPRDGDLSGEFDAALLRRIRSEKEEGEGDDSVRARESTSTLGTRQYESIRLVRRRVR
jgi:hypothetical protein